MVDVGVGVGCNPAAQGWGGGSDLRRSQLHPAPTEVGLREGGLFLSREPELNCRDGCGGPEPNRCLTRGWPRGDFPARCWSAREPRPKVAGMNRTWAVSATARSLHATSSRSDRGEAGSAPAGSLHATPSQYRLRRSSSGQRDAARCCTICKRRQGAANCTHSAAHTPSV